tara:strand:+ start:171 stop:440 length:270 start_codon:yes stop_codon:yes gene_type:complete
VLIFNIPIFSQYKQPEIDNDPLFKNIRKKDLFFTYFFFLLLKPYFQLVKEAQGYLHIIRAMTYLIVNNIFFLLKKLPVLLLAVYIEATG